MQLASSSAATPRAPFLSTHLQAVEGVGGLARGLGSGDGLGRQVQAGEGVPGDGGARVAGGEAWVTEGWLSGCAALSSGIK